MAGYGYAYRSVSTYSTTRTGSRDPAVIKPFAPFVPKGSGSNYSEGAVTKKIIVPVTSRPYDEPATEKYVSSGDESDDELHHQTSPVRSSPRKVVDQFPAKVQQNHEGGRNPQRLDHIVDHGGHSPQPTAEGRKPIGISPIKNDKYDGTNGYGGDHRAAAGDPNLYREGRKPTGISPIKNDNYNGTNAYGGNHRPTAVGDPNLRKEGRKPTGISPTKIDNYHGTNAYGGDRRPTAVGDPNLQKEGRKPTGISPTKIDNYHGTNAYGGDRRPTAVGDPNLHKEGRKPTGISPTKIDSYHDTNAYGGDRRPTAVGDPNLRKEGRKPTGISPTKIDNYHGTNAYGGDHRPRAVGDPNLHKEGRKPIGGDNSRRSVHDGYNNNGYGGEKEGLNSLRSAHDGYNNNGYGGEKEGHKPVGISPYRNDNYHGTNGYGNNHHAAAVGDPNFYKEGHKPIGTGSIRTTRDGYNNGYGGDKEGRRPIESNIKNGNHEYDSPNRYGGDKEGRRPIESNIKNGNHEYDSPNRYGGDYRGAAGRGDPNLYKEEHKPIGGGNIRNSHDGYNSGYSSDKEGYKPIIGSNIENGYHDRPNGYGGDYNKKEGYKPIRNGNYGNGYGNGPKISSEWSAAPRKGIQITEPTHDIDKAMELLKIEAAKRDHPQSNIDHHHYYDSPSPAALDNWSAPGNGSPRFTDRTGSGSMRPQGNLNQPQSRPRSSSTRVTFVDDGRDYSDDDYYRRGDIGHYGYRDAVIDSREAEKKFKGTRV